PPAAAPDRACQQQRQALSYCERPDPPVEGGRPRSRDGALLCPAQLPGTPEPLVPNDLIGINSNVVREVQCLFKTIEKEGLQGGKGDNDWVVRHRYIHAPGIQQEPPGDTVSETADSGR